MSGNLSQLPNGKQVFLSGGVPVAGGQVFFYVPGTTTPKDTWVDYAQTTLNTNPVVLDANGSATIWGQGSYRQIVNDSSGSQIWDEVVTAPTPSTGLGLVNTGADSGAVNAYVVTISGAPTTLITGLMVAASIVNTNTGAATLNFNSTSPITIKRGGAALQGGELAAGTFALFVYDGTFWELLSSAAEAFYFNTPANDTFVQKLPNGFVLQAGTAISSGTISPNIVVTFAEAFTTAGFTAGAMVSGAASGGNIYTLTLVALTSTQLSINILLNGVITSGLGIFWFALGK